MKASQNNDTGYLRKLKKHKDSVDTVAKRLEDHVSIFLDANGNYLKIVTREDGNKGWSVSANFKAIADKIPKGSLRILFVDNNDCIIKEAAWEKCFPCPALEFGQDWYWLMGGPK